MAKVLTVLRSGGEFGPEHVQAMQRQVRKWAPEGTEFACLTDVDVPGVDCIKLQHDWPNWWAKMELFRPDIQGDFLYTDLDNVIVGPIEELLRNSDSGRLLFNRGVNDTRWTSLMCVPYHKRVLIYDWFLEAPARIMYTYDEEITKPPFGDAGFICGCFQRPACWEERLPNQIVNISYLMTPLGFRKPASARIILCHRPHRPWLVPAFKRSYWCEE